MGWRGVLRSAVAASRAADRDSQRRARAVQRGHDRIDRLMDGLDTEVERDLERLRKFEEKIYIKPLSASGISYDPRTRGWAFKPLRDDTGKLKWSLDLELQSEGTPSSGSATEAGRTFEVIEVTATRWAVFVACRISTAFDGGKCTKLFNKTNPSANRLTLVSGGVRYRALEGQLDMDIPIPGEDIALVAFPLPKVCGDDLAIEFLFKSGASRIPVAVASRAAFSDAANMPSLVDRMREQLTAHTNPLRQHASRTKEEIAQAASSGGGAMALIIVLGVVFLMIVFGS